MDKLVVKDGTNIILCDQGSEINALKVTSHVSVPVEGAPAATVRDNKSGKNVKSFGECKITGKKCRPVTPSPWMLGETDATLSCFPVITENSLLHCTVGGIIQVIAPGQSTVTVDSKFELLYDESDQLIGYSVDKGGDLFTYHDTDGHWAGDSKPGVEPTDDLFLIGGIGGLIRGAGKKGIALVTGAGGAKALGKKIPPAVLNRLKQLFARKTKINKQRASRPRTAGETTATKRGREAHKRYNPGPTYRKEFTLPSGRRADAVDFQNKVVRELKPNNPRAIQRGKKQVEQYRRELEREYGGDWKGVVDTY